MDQPVPIPDGLIYYPCEPVGAGGTMLSLAKGYATNTVCIGEYKTAIQGIAQYNNKIKSLRESDAE